MYWGKEFVPLPPTKMENQKPFVLPRLPYKYDSINIETTAYALLVYVARKEPFVDDIVKWLNSQRLTDGGWASTQDTAIAMKALIEYTNRNRLRDVFTLTVTVEATALSGKMKTLKVNSQNIAQLQKIEVKMTLLFSPNNLKLKLFTSSFHKRGVLLKYKLKVRAMQFCKCLFNIMLMWQNSKQHLQNEHLI